MSPECPMMIRGGGTPRAPRYACWSSPFRSRGSECVVIGTPVCWCAMAAADITRATPSVMPASADMTLIMPARIGVPGDPFLDVADE